MISKVILCAPFSHDHGIAVRVQDVGDLQFPSSVTKLCTSLANMEMTDL